MCLLVPNSFSLFDDLQCVRALVLSSAVSRWIRKTVWRCQTDRAQDKVHRTGEKLQYGHVWLMTTPLSPTSFTCNNGHPVSDALHKSNRVPVCLPVGVGERSETAVSVPASCSLPPSVSPQPRLISAFQLSLILLPYCPPHKELGANFTSGNFLCTLCVISAAESWLCVLSVC